MLFCYILRNIALRLKCSFAMLSANFIQSILYTSLSKAFLIAVLGLLPIDQLRSSFVHHCNTILKLTCFNALCLLDLTFLMFKLCQKAFERFSQCLLQDLYTYRRASSLLLLFSEWNSVESRLCKYADIQISDPKLLQRVVFIKG